VADGGVTPPTTLRAKVGRLVQTLIPDLDERQWNRKRDAQMRALTEQGGYEQRLRSVDGSRLDRDRPPHLVIVPKDGPTFDTWRVAGGNFFFEIAQAAREHYGDATVTVFSPEPGESAPEWHARLIRHLVDSGATHLMAMVETDPDGAGTSSWDVLWSQLHPRWDGVFLGVMFDSAYRWITIPVRRIARMCDRFVVVDICMPMDGSMVRGRPEVGPVNMPVSNLSLAAIDEAVDDLPRVHQVTFLGSLYPGRIQMIEDLRAAGVDVAVNPHHGAGDVLDLEGSRANQPGYVGYMQALAQSQITINFGRSSAGEYFQLKTRILEAALMGCAVFTDDVDRTERFWVPVEEFVYFAEPADIPALARELLDDPERLARMQARARSRARSINVASFWGGVDEGLRRRSLTPLGRYSAGNLLAD
jgi:hypothetical protein